MENLNAEAVKKALGSCYPIGATRCKECPYSKNGSVNILFTETHTCYDQMAIDALALINSQEQRIKELTEELTRKETEYNELYELSQDYKANFEAYRSYSKTLEKENETLKTLLDESFDTQNSLTEENERLMRDKTALECVVATARNQAKADTAREMKERLGNRFDEDGNYFGIEVHSKIDQIAKEVLEGDNEN